MNYLAEFRAFVRKAVATALFVVTLSVLPFGALAPDYEVAYLVVADNHSMPQASRILVREGDRVMQGQTIARIGSAGNSTGPHLHFEVHQNDYFRDPLHFLPTR